MKNYLLFLACLLNTIYSFSQNNFEYQRSWSTYFGPVGAKSWIEVATSPILFDDDSNIYLTGMAIGYPNNYEHSYYDQFRVGDGGQNFTMATISNNDNNIVAARFKPNGTLDKYEYYNYLINDTGYRKKLKYIDKDNNFYYEYGAQNTLLPYTPTVNAWRQSSSHPQLGTLLVKETSNGDILWVTYIPVVPETYIYAMSTNVLITGDEAGNVYILGVAYDKEGITTIGAYIEDYHILMENNYETPNGYMVKLNGNNGQLIWGTYLLGIPYNMAYYDNAIYFVGHNMSIHQNSVATTGAFQNSPASLNIQKFNTITGERVWGTFYGTTTTNSHIHGIDVNLSGVYVIGEEVAGTSAPGYFATVGAHQMSNAGNRDLFLSKFNHDGVRMWSTYFGGTGLELIQGSMKPLALNGDNVFITGRTYAATNNIATPNSYKSSPTQSTGNVINHFFAKFNKVGDLEWSSYYGDSNLGFNLPINIAVNKSSIYLYGEALSTTGYTTPNSWQSQIIDDNPSATGQEKNVAFLAKFDLNPLSNIKFDNNRQIEFYSNPNNGNFNLQSTLFIEENCIAEIFDISGKLLHLQNLTHEKTQDFNLSNNLSEGIYFIKVKDSKGVTVKSFKMIVKK